MPAWRRFPSTTAERQADLPLPERRSSWSAATAGGWLGLPCWMPAFKKAINGHDFRILMSRKAFHVKNVAVLPLGALDKIAALLAKEEPWNTHRL